jgi:hypothetical protein
MDKCPKCGGTELRRIDNFRPPHGKTRGKHLCGDACNRTGWLCQRCRFAHLRPET